MGSMSFGFTGHIQCSSDKGWRAVGGAAVEILVCTVHKTSQPYSAALYYTILYYTILYYTILYYTILYYTILYYTILYCTMLYYTIL